METLSSLRPVFHVVGSFWFWVALTAVYIVYRVLTRDQAPIRRKYNAQLMKVGDLAYGGSSKTSNVEKKIRVYLARYMPVLPSSLYMKMGLADKKGNPRKFTPDIIVWNSRHNRTVIEIDPFYTHGHTGMQKVYEDIERNIGYAQAGYKVVRVRINFPAGFHNTALGVNDVVLNMAENRIGDAECAQVVRAVRRAVPASGAEVRRWRKQLDMLQEDYANYLDSQQTQRRW